VKLIESLKSFGSGLRSLHSFEKKPTRITACDGSTDLEPASILDIHLSMTYPIRQAIHQFHALADEHRQLFRFLEALFTYHVPGFDQKSLKKLRFLDLAAYSKRQKIVKNSKQCSE
jgi:hypothetical protein